MKKIMVLSTGGTIVCAPSHMGMTPTHSAQEIVDLVPQIREICACSTKTLFRLDSSDIQPEEWKAIAREVFCCLDEFDGVVILHGTDTMAYTASMLSLMLRNLDKPVILTGSQLPAHDPATDARRNLYHSILAARQDIAGVFVVFDGKLIKGSRVSKVRTLSMNAFDSINAPVFGRIENGRVVFDKPVKSDAYAARELDVEIDPNVFLLKMIPGTRPEIFDCIQSMGYRGLVIEGFGLGGVHTVRRNIIEKIQQMVDAGLAVVLTSQCPYEVSDLTVYEVGRKAVLTGIIPGYDMTSEIAVTKLMWALGHTNNASNVKTIMLTDTCGEIMTC